MTLDLAKSRRLEALTKRSGDRVLVKPGHLSQLSMPKQGTVASYLMEVLKFGCTASELEAETGWSKSLVLQNLYKVAKRSGVGIRRCDEHLHIIMPKGAEEDHGRVQMEKMSPSSDDIEVEYKVVDATAA